MHTIEKTEDLEDTQQSWMFNVPFLPLKNLSINNVSFHLKCCYRYILVKIKK